MNYEQKASKIFSRALAPGVSARYFWKTGTHVLPKPDNFIRYRQKLSDFRLIIPSLDDRAGDAASNML